MVLLELQPGETTIADQLVAGLFTPSVLLALARRLRRLEEHGLEVVEVPVASSPTQFRALIDGELSVAFTSPDNVVAYRCSADNPLGRRYDVSIVSGVDRGMGLALYGRPGLTRAEQLVGARVGVDVPTSGFAVAMYALVESLGVRRDQLELLTLGSTPKRLAALLAGECDATMLNAGNELLAEQAGCVRLVAVADVCAPYLGTVLSVAGADQLPEVRRLAAALRVTAGQIRAGELDGEAAEEARILLGLAPDLAARYVARLKSPEEGLVDAVEVDLDALVTVVELRRRYLPLPPGGDELPPGLGWLVVGPGEA